VRWLEGDKRLARRQTPTEALAQLVELGQFLDATDSGRAPVDPLLYREAARAVRHLLEQEWLASILYPACRGSAALACLLEQVQLEQRLGRTRSSAVGGQMALAQSVLASFSGTRGKMVAQKKSAGANAAADWNDKDCAPGSLRPPKSP
jgi:hypothetical protein